jgi:hypothetical protein
MNRIAWWRSALLVLIGALATRAVWLAWQYYFDAGPRYRLESATIALVIVGLVVAAMRRDDSRTDESTPAPLPIWWLPLFAVAGVALYARAIGLGLLSDDYGLRTMAQSGSLSYGAGWFFRPVPLLVWRGLLAMVDTPAALHLLNLFLHGANAYLTGALGIAMGMQREHALGAAALFLAFPALPEAVAWTAGIQDVLMTTMALAAVVASARASAGGQRIAVVCVLLVLGLLSKETAICIPALIALCWLTPSRASGDARLYGALLLVTIVYLAIRLPMGIGQDYLATPSRYFFKQVLVVAFGTLATPWRDPASAFDRTVAFITVCVLVLALVHTFLTWSRTDRRLHRDIRLALWVLASIAPVFTFFFVGPNLEGSRYLYLAAGAWSLVVVDLIASVTDRSKGRLLAFGVVMAAIVLVFVVSVQRELGVWQRAADLRDRVVTQAGAAMTEAGCLSPSFANLPDSVDGAYVFRNGFSEALGLPPPDARPGCAFAWTGDQFVPTK